jgi:hypothetical protein
MDYPLHLTLEQIQIDLDALAAIGEETFDIWIPESLTLGGREIPADTAIFIMVERAREVGYRPDSVVEGEGGGVFRFRALPSP